MSICLEYAAITASSNGKVVSFSINGGATSNTVQTFIENNLPADTCTTYVLQTAQEYKTLSDVSAVFADYFQFDPTLSELIMTSMLLSFLSGHILGRVISGLRKAG